MLYKFYGLDYNQALKLMQEVVVPVMSDYGVEHPINSFVAFNDPAGILNKDGEEVKSSAAFLEFPAFEELRRDDLLEHVSADLTKELGFPAYAIDAPVVFNP